MRNFQLGERKVLSILPTATINVNLLFNPLHEIHHHDRRTIINLWTKNKNTTIPKVEKHLKEKKNASEEGTRSGRDVVVEKLLT